MDASHNPYNPGAGLRPMLLAGRDREIADFDTVIARTRNGLPNRGLVLSGLRGVGKTVLLAELRSHAIAAGWFVVSIEAQPGISTREDLRERLAREFVASARSLAHRHPSLRERLTTALQSIMSFSAKIGLTGIDLGVTFAPGRGDSGDLELDLGEIVADLSTVLAPEGLAFALFIDEMQDLDPQALSALIATQHAAGQEGHPFYIVGAGLPSLPHVLSEARSYAERIFQYYSIDALERPEAINALCGPAEKMGAEFTQYALDILLDHTEGYPYFLQEFGKAIWEVAMVSPFTGADAEAAVVRANQRLDAGFFRARWDRATLAERDFMRAMVPDAGHSSHTATVAERMGRSRSSISPARGALIGKGILYAPDLGQLAFTVPGMTSFISRQDTDT